MRIIVYSLTAVAILAGTVPATAQEVIVTAQRRAAGDYNGGYANGVVSAQRPIITLKRSADYIVRSVKLIGDARDATVRMNDINATLRNMIATAPKAGVELALGDYVVEPLTEANYRNLAYASDGRPDTSMTTFLVKVKLVPDMDIPAAKTKIDRFIDSVAKVGRSTLATTGEPTLSVVNPDQYRGQIADLIAADAAKMSAKFGPAYGVEVTGLDRPVEWARASPLEVFLYLPSTYIVTRR
ncbi:TonB-dependent receptor [Sphingomonas sp.]|uniref:TonB-dependent receptor n=1 Tax=Sphingomonas sp. TaxID=28214 RepID=UPI0025F90DD3|nr:TonB-dependent receptor [Sphingomonas sp.]